MAEEWDEYRKSVKPLALKKKKPAKKMVRVQKEIAAPRGGAARNDGQKDVKKKAGAEQSLTRAEERELRCGDVTLDARLDLHGKTEKEAHAALVRFIENNAAQGHKTVLVITGKGRDGTSVLRANFPRWCETERLAKAIKMVYPASLKHGGDGAFYVLLRKLRH